MKDKLEAAKIIRDANVPDYAGKINDPAAIAYYAEPIDSGYALHLFKFKPSGKANYTHGFFNFNGLPEGEFHIPAWRFSVRLSASDVARHAKGFLVDMRNIAVPPEVARNQRNEIQKRYQHRRREKLTAQSLIPGFQLVPTLPHLMFKLADEPVPHVIVKKIALGRAMQPHKYEGEHGIRTTQHPIYGGTAIIQGAEFRVTEGRLIPVPTKVIAPAADVPLERFRLSPEAIAYFNEYQPPENFKRLPGCAAYYKASLYRGELFYEFRWGTSVQDSAFKEAHESNLYLDVSGIRYNINNDFTLSFIGVV